MFSHFVSDLKVYFEQGGFVMTPLFLFTVVLWYAIGVRHSILKRGNRRSVRELLRRVDTGKLTRGRGIVDSATLKAKQVKAARDECYAILRAD